MPCSELTVLNGKNNACKLKRPTASSVLYTPQ